MKNIAIYPGTFDPITHGHTDIIQRSSQLFDHVIVAIAENTNKGPSIPFATRLSLTKQVLATMPTIEVKGFNSLLIDFAKEHHANIIIRGLRAVSDFEYEFQLAGMNRQLSADIETIFLTPTATHSTISSSLVREIAQLGGNISQFVDPIIADHLTSTAYSKRK